MSGYSKRRFELQYLFTVGRNLRMEFLGLFTVFNYRRSFKVKTERLIHYSSDDKRLYLNLHTPKNRGDAPLPVIIYLHGGGWVSGSPEGREAFTTTLSSFGYCVVNVAYGLSPFFTHPKQPENVFKAIDWVFQNKDKYNFDTSRIFIGGESAGAHLAAMVGGIATNAEYRKFFTIPKSLESFKPKGLILNCGVYDMEETVRSGFRNIDFYTTAYFGKPFSELSPDERIAVSPIYSVTKSFPPSFVISAEYDKLRQVSNSFLEKLSEERVPFTHYLGVGRLAVHAFAIAQVLKISREAMAGIRKFLSKNI